MSFKFIILLGDGDAYGTDNVQVAAYYYDNCDAPVYGPDYDDLKDIGPCPDPEPDEDD